MKRYKSTVPLLTLILAFIAIALSPVAGAAQGDAERRQAVHKTAEAFVAAYAKGDAKAIASFWLPDADYKDLTGRTISGRAAIQQAFAEAFAQSSNMQLRIEVASLKFPTPQTAVEHGTTSILGPDGRVLSRADYTNLLVEQDGKWLLASVRESPYAPPSNYENLRPLEWAIGVWEHDVEEGPVAAVSFDWTPDNNFIVSFQTMIVDGEPLSNGTQTIGWDPSTKQIRSWRFESDGGFGESAWANDGQTWTIKTKSVLRSGGKMESTNIVKLVDADHITVQTVDQKLDGKPLPNGPVIKMKRVN
jgi:uncharacterized protein (TIGR02246 family)